MKVSGNKYDEPEWGFPKGKKDLDEEELNCARREFKEETGADAVDIRLLTIINDTPTIKGQDNHYVRFVYLITDWEGEIVNAEPDRCEGWQWFEKDNLPEPIFVGHQKVMSIYLDKVECLEGVNVLEE